MSNNNKTLALTQFSMLLALEAIVCFTPLGSLPAIGPIVATLGMIPVAITAILLGTRAGAAMGAIAGFFSFCVWTFTPPFPPMAFIFTPVYSLGEIRGNFLSLVICFVPRIMVGVVASLVYKFYSRRLVSSAKSEIPAYILAGALGSLANTVGVLGGIYLFFAAPYANAVEISRNLVLMVLSGQVLTSGLPEAIACAVSCGAVCGAVKKYMSKKV